MIFGGIYRVFQDFFKIFSRFDAIWEDFYQNSGIFWDLLGYFSVIFTDWMPFLGFWRIFTEILGFFGDLIDFFQDFFQKQTTKKTVLAKKTWKLPIDRMTRIDRSMSSPWRLTLRRASTKPIWASNGPMPLTMGPWGELLSSRKISNSELRRRVPSTLPTRAVLHHTFKQESTSLNVEITVGPTCNN